ncbi:two pore calcium channel protein 2 [Aplysia californica]|uniref:Two pore calcium channel protein 2 n=1 Tax=Aplysia californica TaxID=6500 RepID=A0ABM1W0K7_APLCA|nr:two pore calcium channel protein 2 [Aplysia californica]
MEVDASSSTEYDIDTSSISFPKGNHRINDSGTFDGSPDVEVPAWRARDDSGSEVLSTSVSDIHATLDESSQFAGLDGESILQAVVFIEDAFKYRSINHKVGAKDLQVYREYTSFAIAVFRFVVIFLLHMLAFVEFPSSLSLSADLRQPSEPVTVPCWLTQSIEIMCLLILLIDNVIKMHLLGGFYFVRHKWDMGAVIIIIVSIIDWIVSFSLGCTEYIRFRRILRPYFILQNSSLMKKIVNCLRMTLPEVISVLLLLALHLFVFTLFGMLLFPEYEAAPSNVTMYLINSSTPGPVPTPSEGHQYFHSLLDSLVSLLVLLTTANNPDVTMPAYSRNRYASLFFILYLFIGLYCLMNMLLAVIYNQFRGYFLSSMQSSLLRRRLGVRAAFEVLRRKKCDIQGSENSAEGTIEVGVGGHVIKSIVGKSLLPKHIKSVLIENLERREDYVFSATEFQKLFYCLDSDVVHKQKPAVTWCASPRWRMVQRVFLHKYFTYFGILMAFINLIIITVQLGAKYDSSFRESHSLLRIVNFSFVIYYLVEQAVKVWAFGWRRYLSDNGNKFDAFVTLALVIGEIYSASCYGLPYFPGSKEVVVHSSSSELWNVIRIINILIMVRMFRIIPHIKSMSLVTTVLVDLMKNMKSFAGVLIVIFYAFAIFGMELFHDVIKYDPSFENKTFECGTYEQLNYWANNFDDFFAAIVVLWDVMVVNNWHVFLQVFREKTSPWSYLFFIAWWLLSVIIVLNLFTALIMENFIMKWDRRHQIVQSAAALSSSYEGLTVSVYLNNVHSMFRDMLQEPADNELLILLSDHHYLSLDR